MLKLKASCASPSDRGLSSAEENLIDAANECCNIYQDMLSAGVECKEIEDVMHDILFVRDEVRNRGIRAYYYTFDKENKFASLYGCTPYEPGMGIAFSEKLRTQYVEAAEEGLKVWWTKFIEAIKNLLSKFVAWCQTTFTFRNGYIEKATKNKDKLDKLDLEKSVECMDHDDCRKIMKAIDTIHDTVKKCVEEIDRVKGGRISETLIKLFDKNPGLMEIPRYVKDDLDKVGFEIDFGTKDDPKISLNEKATGLSDACKIESKTVKDHKFTAQSAKTLVDDISRVESKDNFKKMTGKIQDSLKKCITEFEDQNDELKKEDDSKAETIDGELINAIHGMNAMVRFMNRLVVVENKLMVRVVKTALVLEDAVKEEK